MLADLLGKSTECARPLMPLEANHIDFVQMQAREDEKLRTQLAAKARRELKAQQVDDVVPTSQPLDDDWDP
jgi:hypothetical protein